MIEHREVDEFITFFEGIGIKENDENFLRDFLLYRISEKLDKISKDFELYELEKE